MRRILMTGAALCLTGLTACAGLTPTEQRVLSGSAIGAGAGAVVGAAAGEPGIGAGVGAAAGAIGGLIVDEAEREREYYGGDYYDDDYYEDDYYEDDYDGD